MNLGKALTIHKCFPLLHYWNHGCTKGCSPVPRALLEWAFSVINASRRCCFICFRGLQSRQTGCAMPLLWSLIKTGCCTSIMLLFQVSEGSRTQLCFLFSHRCVFLLFFFLSTFGSLKNKMKSVWSVCRLVWQIRFIFIFIYFFIMQWAARLLLRVIDRPLDIAAISTWTVDFGLLTALLMSLAPYRCRT